jgi:hypothetical protein
MSADVVFLAEEIVAKSDQTSVRGGLCEGNSALF